MALFELLDPSDTEYSNTIELYDALPKGVWSGKQKRGKKSDGDAAQEAAISELPKVITRPFKSRGTSYQMKVKPAIIERVNDAGEIKTLVMFPGTREELIEEALRKFAVQGQGFESDNTSKDVGVFFTVNQLRKELARTGHSYSAQEILEALDIMSSSLIEVSQTGRNRSRETIRGNMLGSMLIASREQYLENSGVKCYATFHPLVTQGIRTQQFRIYDYSVSMSMKSDLGRYMYKRLSHYWVQASLDHPYEFKLTTFLSQSPRGLSERMKDNLRAVRNALKSLVDEDVILPDWEEIMIKNAADKRIVDDVGFRLLPSESFIKFMMKANRRQSDIRGQAELLTARASLKQGSVTSEAEPGSADEPDRIFDEA
ncbi:replication protein [Pseudomonas aeruginosa]|nr:replication protein [Pseudomonas aeruginosa]EKV3012168.1 replication protein [Pseudomonas aeruginosa]MBH4318837.1 replication protein [Pseudomonas aeruginosa]MBH8701072.1 replication protein [Pseudomonas aeruginosa]HEK3610442.1 replication protein [Pseudomonas aeruginosa]